APAPTTEASAEATPAEPRSPATTQPEGPRPLPPPRIVREGPMPGAGDDERERAGLGLRRQSDGTYLYIDPYKRFTATFNQDGTVHFADRWKRPDNENTQRGKCCGPPRGLFGPNGMQVTGPYEWIIALHGIDIYGRVKADLLARTREVRIALAISYNRELLGRRLAALEGELGELWGASGRAAAARRALLFQRWDECDEAFAIKAGEIPEEALSEMDRDRIATAERARRQIEAFIRDKLPQRSKHGYSPAELAALNARRQSRQPFDPYRTR
ncbi:MAG: hypothetical protein KC420_01775, partial [Myxococcales bacterium]|nr:hypothetical protein [Myxococcales bacterium]